LGLLIGPEARRKSVEIVISNALIDNVRVPSTPIRQAVLNLILNAVAAAPEGSQVCVSAELVGKQLAIAVTDRGPGLPTMEAEVLTGRSGAPTPLDGGGLGLWTISRLVADIGGRIAVEYPASGGTAVKLALPTVPMELSNVA
jgi:K+-sensing histidine kinase KdpD